MKDARGHFMVSHVSDEFAKFELEFKQSSISYSKQKVFRGFHLQANQWQLITLVEGSITDYLIDLDVNSPTFRMSIRLDLEPHGLNQVLIRPSIAHAYFVNSPNSTIQYMHTEEYDPNLEIGISYKDEVFQNVVDFDRAEVTISERDKALGSFEDALTRLHGLS
jgi:dTDP-4-dehydrorhamnose 3,5-epimerase